MLHPVYRALPSVAGAFLPARPFIVRETTPVTPPKPRLLDRVRAALQARHYSRRTEGGKDVILGRRLLDHAKDALKRGGSDGLKRYYERCLDLNDPKGRRVKATLERNGRETLESEHSRFLAAYNSGAKQGG